MMPEFKAGDIVECVHHLGYTGARGVPLPNRPPNRVYQVVEPARWEREAGLVALEDSEGIRNALSPDWLKRL